MFARIVAVVGIALASAAATAGPIEDEFIAAVGEMREIARSLDEADETRFMEALNRATIAFKSVYAREQALVDSAAEYRAAAMRATGECIPADRFDAAPASARRGIEDLRCPD